MQTLSGVVTDIQRLKSSTNGNPRYQFVVGGQIITTAVDCMYGYEITNFIDKHIVCDVAVKRGKLTLINIHRN